VGVVSVSIEIDRDRRKSRSRLSPDWSPVAKLVDLYALAVSVSPFFEPAKVTFGGLIFSPWVDFLMTLGGFCMTFGELLKFVR
jgi:hypothetical protein